MDNGQSGDTSSSPEVPGRSDSAAEDQCRRTVVVGGAAGVAGADMEARDEPAVRATAVFAFTVRSISWASAGPDLKARPLREMRVARPRAFSVTWPAGGVGLLEPPHDGASGIPPPAALTACIVSSAAGLVASLL